MHVYLFLVGGVTTNSYYIQLKSCFLCSSLSQVHCVLFLSKPLFTLTTCLSANVYRGVTCLGKLQM